MSATTMPLRAVFFALSMGFAFFAAGGARAQAPFFEACVSAIGAGPQVCERGAVAPLAVSGIAYADPGQGGWPIGSGSARALAQFGTLKGQTSATALTPPSGTAGASAYTRFFDALVITGPGREGTVGFLDVRIDYEWQMSNGLGTNIADLVLEFGPNAAYAREQRSQALNQAPEDLLVPLGIVGDAIPLGAQLGRYFEVRFPFVYGVEYVFTQSLSLNSQASFGATLSIDAFNSVYWGGMVVRDADLGAVPFTAVSQSGLDYSISYAPIPEPGTWALWAAGLLSLGTRRLRKHRLG